MTNTGKPVKVSARLDASESAAGWHTVTISREIGERFPSDGRSRRVVCTFNGKETIHCALMPSGDRFFIMVNKRIRTALGVSAGDMLKLSLEHDKSKYGLPAPDELLEVFRQDIEGDRLFHNLTPGKQRSLIYVVSSAKDVDRRIHRALIIVEHLKNNDGRVESKTLYHELRRPLM